MIALSLHIGRFSGWSFSSGEGYFTCNCSTFCLHDSMSFIWLNHIVLMWPLWYCHIFSILVYVCCVFSRECMDRKKRNKSTTFNWLIISHLFSLCNNTLLIFTLKIYRFLQVKFITLSIILFCVKYSLILSGNTDLSCLRVFLIS